MALQFPASPTVGQVFGGWMWDSVKWGPAGASPNFPLPIVNGGTGANNAAGALASLGAMPIAGGTFTGSVSMSGNASGALQPVPLQQMNAALGGYLPLAGGTMTGSIIFSGNVGISTPSGTVSASNISGGIGNIGEVVFAGGGEVTASSMTATTMTAVNAVIPDADSGASCGIPGRAWFQVAAYNFPQQSDPRTKKDIAAAPSGALAQVEGIPVHQFHYLADGDEAPLHWGFLSTEVHQTMGDNFAGWMQGTDVNRTESINIMDMLAVLWAAVQQLSAKAGISA